MRNDMKIGIIVGVLVVLGIIIFLVSPGGDSRQKESQTPAPPADQGEIPAQTPPVTTPPQTKSSEIVVVPPEGQKPALETKEIITKPDAEIESPPPAQPEPSERLARYHIVKEGDTLSRISEQYFGHERFWTVIHQANKDLIQNPDRLQVGWKLRIPYPDEVKKNP